MRRRRWTAATRTAATRTSAPRRPTSSSPRRTSPRRLRLEGAHVVLVLLRHAESEWNAADRFNGWADVGLTGQGRLQAAAAGQCLKRHGLVAFDDVHSSALCRTVETLEALLGALGVQLPQSGGTRDAQAAVPTLCATTLCRSWQLNERHYGALTGLTKADARAKFGSARVQAWRRGFDVMPPPMPDDHAWHAAILGAYAAVGGAPSELPRSESLAMTEARVVRYMDNAVAPQLRNQRRVLIAAHNNVIRTIVNHLDGSDQQLSPQALEALEIPNAVPLVYALDADLRPTATAPLGEMRGAFLVVQAEDFE
ncbi:histidine phosphatase superfamily [Pelagophyceae sp. CCMP2097]|nr:histidine phosphatase superfamily [Pelagophyceae sp. CCMP2097]